MIGIVFVTFVENIYSRNLILEQLTLEISEILQTRLHPSIDGNLSIRQRMQYKT